MKRQSHLNLFIEDHSVSSAHLSLAILFLPVASLSPADLSINNPATDIFEERLDRAITTRSCEGCALNYLSRENIQLQDAWLPDIQVFQSDFDRIDFSGAYLINAGFIQSSFDSANFQNSNLVNSAFSSSSFQMADFRDANLQETEMNYSRLRNAVFDGADLSHVKIYSTDLDGADFRNADLSGITLTKSFYNSSTRFPEGFEPSQAGALLMEPYTVLIGADLVDISIDGEDLSYSNFTDSNFADSSVGV